MPEEKRYIYAKLPKGFNPTDEDLYIEFDKLKNEFSVSTILSGEFKSIRDIAGAFQITGKAAYQDAVVRQSKGE